MRVDVYTKAVLTVIAAALLYLCVAVTPVGTPLAAQATAASRVHIAGWVDSRGQVHALSADEGLPMRLGAMASLGSSVPTPATGATAPRSLAESPRAPATAAPSARVQCQATTQRGAQCKRIAPAGQRYCWQHAR